MSAAIRRPLVITAALIAAIVVVQVYLGSGTPTVIINMYEEQGKRSFEKTKIVVPYRLRDSYLSLCDGNLERGEHNKWTGATVETGTVNVHIWESICCPKVNSLRQFPLFPSLPNKRMLLTSLAAGSRGTWYGQRIFGYLHPPVSGFYSFAIEAHLFAELWLSTTSDPSNAMIVAKVARPGLGDTNDQNPFTKLSRAVPLQKGRRYFIDVLHVANGGTFNRDHVTIRWKIPECNEFQIVTGEFLSTFMNENQTSKARNLNDPKLKISVATVDSEMNDKDAGEDDEDYNDVTVSVADVIIGKQSKYEKLFGNGFRKMKTFTRQDFNILLSFLHNGFKSRAKNNFPFLNTKEDGRYVSELLQRFSRNFQQNDTVLDMLKTSPRIINKIISQKFANIELSDILPTCAYKPSYVRPKLKLQKFEGVWHTHYSSVFPDDGTSSFMCLGYTQKIDCSGNKVIKQGEVIAVVEQLMKIVTAKQQRQYSLVTIVNLEKNADPLRGARYLLELILLDRLSSRFVLISDYVYKLYNTTDLCKPANITWRRNVAVNMVLTVKNQGAWAQHFVDDLSRIIKETRDRNINVIVVDYSNTDIDIEAALKRSAVTRYRVLNRKGRFHKTEAIQSAVDTISDPHSIVLLIDLHLSMPSILIDSVRKHTIEGRMTFTPVLFRLSFCGRPSNAAHIAARRGFWETFGFGIIGMYKSDWTRFGGMDTQRFKDKWGGEDWEMIDRLLASGLEVERLRMPGFYHFYHPKNGMWEKAQ